MNWYFVSVQVHEFSKGPWVLKEEKPIKPLSGKKAVWNLILWPELDRCMAKINADAQRPSHPFRVFFSPRPPLPS